MKRVLLAAALVALLCAVFVSDALASVGPRCTPIPYDDREYSTANLKYEPRLAIYNSSTNERVSASGSGKLNDLKKNQYYTPYILITNSAGWKVYVTLECIVDNEYSFIWNQDEIKPSYKHWYWLYEESVEPIMTNGQHTVDWYVNGVKVKTQTYKISGTNKYAKSSATATPKTVKATATPEPTPYTPESTGEYTVSSYDQLLTAVCDASYFLKTKITINFASSNMYSTVKGWNDLGEIAKSAGIYSYSYNWFDSQKQLVLYPKTYYPGKRIGYAYMMDDTSFLTDKEKDTLKAAKKLLKNVKSDSTEVLKTEKAIHDALIKSVKYDDTKYDTADLRDRDTAIGALKNGKADCDGYADAFYLLCRMKGLDVRYLHVDVKMQEGTHMLNLIKLPDGRWYMVDAAWDDTKAKYRCFNIGAGMGNYYYAWNQTLFGSTIAERANDNYTNVSYFFSGSGSALNGIGELNGYLKNQYKSGYRHVVVTLKGTDYTTKQLAAKVPSHGSWYYWHWTYGGYTYFEVYWY